MTNGLDYVRPGSLADALRLRRENDGARFVAGGTDLVVQLCASPPKDPGLLISLRAVPELSAIEEQGDAFRIGAAVTVRDLADSPVIRAAFPALAVAAGALGGPQVRNVATVGGNLCNASPCADLPPSLIAYGARAEVHSTDGERREMPLVDLFVAPGQVSLADGELLTAILLDRPGPAVRAVYLRKGRVQMDLSMASTAVVAELDGETCTHVRIVAGGVAPTPLCLQSVEDALVGQVLTQEVIDGAAAAAAAAVAPITDIRATEGYRRHLIGVFVRRALTRIAAGEQDAPRESCGPPAVVPRPGPDLRRGRRKISFDLNGRTTTVDVDPGARLIDVLRDDLGQTGTKEGCSQGECGACTVLVDGRTANSCLYPATEAHGRRITTIEGLSGGDDGLSALQHAFVEEGGIQCGFCTPGMIVSAQDLLDREPDPQPETIARALTGNLCRCTGYVQIVRSIQVAAGVLARREDVR